MPRPTSRRSPVLPRRADSRHAALRALSPLAPPYKMIATLDIVHRRQRVFNIRVRCQGESVVHGIARRLVLGGSLREDAAHQGPVRAQAHREDRVRARAPEDLLRDGRRGGLRRSRSVRRKQDARRDSTPRDIVYEPTRKELYVATRDPRLLVFDGVSGRAGDDVPLPGWFGTQLEAIPGRVFVLLEDKQGLYVIDAATHHVAPVARHRTAGHAGVSSKPIRPASICSRRSIASSWRSTSSARPSSATSLRRARRASHSIPVSVSCSRRGATTIRRRTRSAPIVRVRTD